MVAEKTKRITRKSAGRQVRLWVRAKFLGFRRYSLFTILDLKFNKIPAKAFLDYKESTTQMRLHTISVKELFISTKPVQVKRTRSSE